MIESNIYLEMILHTNMDLTKKNGRLPLDRSFFALQWERLHPNVAIFLIQGERLHRNHYFS